MEDNLTQWSGFALAAGRLALIGTETADRACCRLITKEGSRWLVRIQKWFDDPTLVGAMWVEEKELMCCAQFTNGEVDDLRKLANAA